MTRLRALALSILALSLFLWPIHAERSEAAALSSFAGSVSVQVTGSANIGGATPAFYTVSASKAIPITTGTGTSGGAADMAYQTTVTLASGASATAIDLRSLAQAGNTQVMVAPKWILLEYISGSGTCFFDRGATNGYTGYPADGISVSALRPVALIPVTVQTGASDKTIDYSETGSASVVCRFTALGSSA